LIIGKSGGQFSGEKTAVNSQSHSCLASAGGFDFSITNYELYLLLSKCKIPALWAQSQT